MKENTKDFFEDMKQEFKDLGGKFNRMVENMVKGSKNDKPFEVKADVYEDVDALVFEIDLPGFKKADVTVQVRENNLVVRGSRSRSQDIETVKFHINERSFTPFERSFTLPLGVEPTEIKAKFEDGILRISVPVVENAFEERTVDID